MFKRKALDNCFNKKKLLIGTVQNFSKILGFRFAFRDKFKNNLVTLFYPQVSYKELGSSEASSDDEDLKKTPKKKKRVSSDSE
jgi:hypothetical protein